MRSINKKIAFGDNLSRNIFISTGLLFILIPFICVAQNQDSQPSLLFQGKINANNINIRSDSTASSRIICIANKGEPVEVVKELYEWYKIRLLKKAPSFIMKNLVALIDDKTVKVIKDNVNIRLNPDESSPILGKADKNEVINILSEKREWYRIEPINESFGWVHKKFVDKTSETTTKRKEVGLAQKMEPDRANPSTGLYIAEKKASQDENVTIQGIIKPYGKVIKRTATHKLIALDNNVFFLKGNKGGLDSLNYHKVRVTGKLIHPKGQKYTIIEIQKIEAMD